MSEYSISAVSQHDKRTLQEIDSLLEREGIQRDGNLDYICAMLDENYRVIGTGSCFGNTLRCFAVSSDHQGEGLLNQIISHLIQVQYERGNLHLFLYTKCQSSRFFGDLGFYEVARVDGKLVFMENRKTGFSSYLKRMKKGDAPPERTAALVMNANPFTLGHQYLVEKAASENEVLHLFMVSEDASLVPFSVRKRLIQEGTSHLDNIIYHDSGPYIISSATFPSYFLKDEAAVIDGHARLDIAVFQIIAAALGIGVRYVGEEPTSQVTGSYNRIMAEELPKAGIDCRIIPRKERDGEAISASNVRKCIQIGDWETLFRLVPTSTWRFFRSEEALPVIERIQKAGDVIHY
ncbi:MAG: [Citrate [pro-3S]-lyase] ligase [Enterocloster aldenensis]